MAKTDLVQMPAKIDSARAAYARIADGRNYGEEMKGCALNVLDQHKQSGSVESTHTATFIALSASTDSTVDWMVKTLAGSLTEPEKRDFAESRGLQNLEEVYSEMTSDYITHQIALVEASCKVGGPSVLLCCVLILFSFRF